MQLYRLYALIVTISIILDQATKWVILKTMELSESISVIDGFFMITSHRNRGAAWGILEGKMYFFYAITVFFVGFILYWLKQEGKQQPFFSIGLSLMLGGALGNFIDRLFRGEVVDFFHFVFGTYHFPIFNVADICLTVGVGITIIAMFYDEYKSKRNIGEMK
ncbi:MAG: signal peptidase II [Bacilli bacterium]